MSLKNRFNKTRFRNNKFLKNIYINGKGNDYRIRFVSKEMFDPEAHIYYDHYLHQLITKEGWRRYYKCLGYKNNCPACKDAALAIDAEKRTNSKREAWKRISRKWALYYGFVYDDKGKRELAIIHVPDYNNSSQDDGPTPNMELQSKLVGIEKASGIDVFDSKEGRDVIIKNKGEQNAIVTKIDFDPKSRKPLTKDELEAVKKAKGLEELYQPVKREILLSAIQKVPVNEVKDFDTMKKEKDKKIIEHEKINVPSENKTTKKESLPKETKEEAPKEEPIDGDKIQVETSDINVDLDKFFSQEDDSLDDKFKDIMDNE